MLDISANLVEGAKAMSLLILSAAAFSYSLDGFQLSWWFLPQLFLRLGEEPLIVLAFFKKAQALS